MTSALAAGGQSIFAALSFTSTGYLFKIFDKNGYEKEMKRHNLVTEALVEVKEKFYKELFFIQAHLGACMKTTALK